ncbi:MAG: metallophosphoesterase [Christensenellales bacterium]
MKYFVSSDIHGFFDEWQNALKEKGFDLKNSEHEIILCGDLFDRGSQPKEIIDFVLKHKDKIILIRGNHEDLMEQMIERNSSDYGDLCNGTAQTIVDLYPEWQISGFDLKKIAKETRLQEVLDMCVDYYETKHYIFVHGWIPIIENCYLYDSNWRTARKERWEKARWANPVEMFRYEIYEPNKTIVFGHWHCSALWHEQNPDEYEEFGDKANFEPFITENMIAIDTCTVHTRKVNVIVLEEV